MYTSYFGFRETPFSVTPDPRFFYTNPLYQEALAALLYGIKARKGFIVITGEVGTGKTTLLRKLMRNLEATIHSVLIFNTRLSFPELLQLILQDLGLDYKRMNTLKMVQELNQYLMEQVQKGDIVCLLIDEAQNLSDDTLEGIRLLSNLETDKEKLLQIVLTGQPELEKKLDQLKLRQLKQRVALRCRLDRLKEQEVGPFIDFRLRAVGYEGYDLFNPDAIHQIALHSKGIPRLINIICDNALLITYAGSQKRVSADMIREVAHDLRLGLEVQPAETETTTDKMVSKNGKDQRLIVLTDEAHQSKPRGVTGIGLGVLLVLLLLGGLASVSDPLQDKGPFWGLEHDIRNLLSTAGERLEVLRHSLNGWLADLTTPRTAERVKVQESLESGLSVGHGANFQSQGPSNPNGKSLALADQSKPASFSEGKDPGKQERSSKPDFHLASRVEGKNAGERNSRTIVIQYGSTIFKIASDAYGANRILGMDLIKEFNPQIKNLNWVFAGEGVRLPPITRETMLRKQPDGSYRLILGSFGSSLEADELARIVSYQGYHVVITPQRVADDFLLHRVEIERIENPEAASRVWDTAVQNRWFSFDGSPAGESSNQQNLNDQQDQTNIRKYEKRSKVARRIRE